MRIHFILFGGLNRSGFDGPRIDGVAQLLGGFEERNSLGRDVDLGAGLGVATGARVPLPGPEASEAADLDLVAGFEGADDGFEESIDDDLAIATGEVAEGGYLVDKISFGHERFLSIPGRANPEVGNVPRIDLLVLIINGMQVPCERKLGVSSK